MQSTPVEVPKRVASKFVGKKLYLTVPIEDVAKIEGLKGRRGVRGLATMAEYLMAVGLVVVLERPELLKEAA